MPPPDRIGQISRLLTFAPMIDSEACRFVLAHYDIPYCEEPHLFGWASLLSLWHGFTVRIPLLYGAGVTAAGPRQLVDLFDRTRAPSRKLLSEDKAIAQQVSADWDSFNNTFGTAVAVFAYYQLLPLRSLMTELFCSGVPAYEQWYLRRAYPSFAGLFKLLLQLNPQHAQESLATIRFTFDNLDKRLSDGRRYLTGDRFTLSDIALAASAAPVLLPPGFTAPLPTIEQMPPDMAALIVELRQTETARFVERIYLTHRANLVVNVD